MAKLRLQNGETVYIKAVSDEDGDVSIYAANTKAGVNDENVRMGIAFFSEDGVLVRYRADGDLEEFLGLKEDATGQIAVE